MAMRVTGLYSGLDTESIIKEMVAAKQTKVDNLKKDQTKLEWKQEAWKDLNDKIKKLFNGTLDNLQLESSYAKKTTSVSNSNLVSILTGDMAMNSVSSLEIKALAKEGFLTGAKIADKDGKTLSSGSKLVEKLGIAAGSKFEVNTGGKTTEIVIDENTTISSLVSKLNSAGVNASFDAANQRMFIGASSSGKNNDFAITAYNKDGTDALEMLGILSYDTASKAVYKAYADMGSIDSEAGKAAVKAKVNELLKVYKAEKEGLEKEVKTLEESQEAIAKDYAEKYDKDGKIDLTDETARAARKTALADDITRIEEELTKADTEEKKEALREEQRAAQAELASIERYDKNQASIDEKNARIGVLDKDYINEDGTAGAKIEEEAKGQLKEKIDKAVDIMAAWETLKDSADIEGGNGANRIEGQDSVILLNGIQYTSDSNTQEVNGLTITCKGETNGEVITVTTERDTSGIYDMIKDFVKEYSSLINEMDKLYNAESSKGYDPLTDEEKDAMSDTAVEKWEDKIKGSLLRRDSTLSTVSSAMKEIMLSGFDVNGNTMHLSDFGIETLGYFNALDNEKNAYHINGDKDDAQVKAKDNDLEAMIKKDPDTVIGFFTQLSKSMHAKLNDLMARTEYSSSFSVYEDKKMKDDYSDYTTKIKEAEKKLTAYEDKWYSKFSAMETALAKLQSNTNAVTSLLGGS